jgi:hypothetical protein
VTSARQTVTGGSRGFERGRITVMKENGAITRMRGKGRAAWIYIYIYI